MRFEIRTLVLVTAACAVSSTALAARPFTEEFASGATRPGSIAILPVEATIVRAKVAETQGLVDESVVYGELFAEQLESHMTGKGYTVQIVDPVRINADPKLQEYVVDANRAYDEMMSGYRPKKLRRRELNAGDSTRLLADYLGVDAIAFATLNMTITPAGKAIVSALIGGATSGTNAMMGLVSGSTGDLEAVLFGVNFVPPGDLTDAQMQAEVVQVAERTANGLPPADPSLRVEVAAGDDEESLEEIEALLAR